VIKRLLQPTTLLISTPQMIHLIRFKQLLLSLGAIVHSWIPAGIKSSWPEELPVFNPAHNVKIWFLHIFQLTDMLQQGKSLSNPKELINSLQSESGLIHYLAFPQVVYFLLSAENF
jgi:hypothetical protein